MGGCAQMDSVVRQCLQQAAVSNWASSQLRERILWWQFYHSICSVHGNASNCWEYAIIPGGILKSKHSLIKVDIPVMLFKSLWCCLSHPTEYFALDSQPYISVITWIRRGHLLSYEDCKAAYQQNLCFTKNMMSHTIWLKLLIDVLMAVKREKHLCTHHYLACILDRLDLRYTFPRMHYLACIWGS